MPSDWYDLFRKYGFKTVRYAWERIPATHVAKCIFRLDGTTYWIFVAAVCSYDSGWLDAASMDDLIKVLAALSSTGNPPNNKNWRGRSLDSFGPHPRCL